MSIARLIGAQTIGLALLLVSGPASAEQSATAERVPTVPASVSSAVYGDGYVAPVRSALHESVIRDLEARMERAKDPKMRAQLSQLAGHYRAFGATLHWVDANGLTPNGRALLGELQSADAFGLDPSRLDLPETPLDGASEAVLSDAEASLAFSAVLYADHARGGRVDPSQLSFWLDQRPRGLYVSDVFRAIDMAGDPVAGLRSFHPQHPQFERLRRAYLAERGVIARNAFATIPEGPDVAVGERHADVALIRARLEKPASDPADSDLLDRGLMRAIQRFMSEGGYGRARRIDDSVRQALNRPEPVRYSGNRARINKLLVNMERWRLMPEDMGALYVWNNLPEFQTRVVKAGEVIHQERIIIGKPNTQTPVFSDEMSHIDFNPEWGVPESIKIRQLLPRLRGGDTGVLARRNMRIKYDDGTIRDPKRIRWAKQDIRMVPIVQGPGPGNPLGRVKFMFPNGHSVYMHDTPDKYLFDSSERTFSHGCIRVRNPQRFAEVILGEVERWSVQDVARVLKNTKDTMRVRLKHRIPVHNTYFTMWVNADGSIVDFRDVYSHDARIGDALAGKPFKVIAARDPALALQRENEDLRKNIAAIGPLRPKVIDGLPQQPVFVSMFGQPLPPGPPKGIKTYSKSSLGANFKPPKKTYYSPTSPPMKLWFQQ
ncbi:MAG: L,D-transpeptidase family protein [Hyphomicrobium sp.]|nr:L,D-transpeptidase family protein [Hyphomicrobium sp.]